jgi:hypothetical protein
MHQPLYVQGPLQSFNHFGVVILAAVISAGTAAQRTILCFIMICMNIGFRTDGSKGMFCP